MSRLAHTFGLLAMLLSLPSHAADGVQAREGVQTREGVTMSISARTPEQIKAFFSARGFAKAALASLRDACFLTVGIRNASNDVVWLELDRFKLSDEAGKPLSRITRAQWKTRFKKFKVPAASQATFGWTQLPETRDLQPDEPVGGNIALPRHNGPIKLVAEFRREGKSPLVFEFPNLRCPQ